MQEEFRAPAYPSGFSLRAVWRAASAWASRGGHSAVQRAEQQALRAQAQLREALDVLPEGIVFLDREGRYVLWNKKYSEIYHRSADLFAEGVKLADTLRIGVGRGDYPEAIGREEAWLADRLALLDNPGQRHQQQLADGRWVLIEERRTGDGGVIGLRVDITDMKRQAEALEAALQRAEAASRAKTEFLANLSHEIRTPLNGVLGLAEVLSRTDLDASQRDVLATLGASAEALNQTLADLLDFSQLEAGKVAIVKEAFDLAGLVAQAAAEFEKPAWDKGLALVVDIADEARTEVIGDPARLRQILSNLLSNAVKFTPQGRITLSVGAADQAGDYRFAVEDTGMGFDEADAEHLFGSFQQADGSFTRAQGGLGLGLSICRQLAELMGGALQAEGRRGRGSTFTLTTPLAPSASDVHAADRAAMPTNRSARILIVDDVPTNRKLIELILESVGVETVSVENGLEAVVAVEQSSFDLVLMDLQMPVMDGLTAIRKIREWEAGHAGRRLPIVVISANFMPEHLQASTAAGADGHMSKPVGVEDLISVVIDVMQAEAAEDDAAPVAAVA
jgi:signal transduction histidine kinase/CheY-like chemotaxis protein